MTDQMGEKESREGISANGSDRQGSSSPQPTTLLIPTRPLTEEVRRTVVPVTIVGHLVLISNITSLIIILQQLINLEFVCYHNTYINPILYYRVY